MKHIRKFSVYILLFFFLLSGVAALQIALTVSNFVKLETQLAQEDGGFFFYKIQHEANPLELPAGQQTLDAFDFLTQELSAIPNATYYEIYGQPLDYTGVTALFFDGAGQPTSTPQGVPALQISANVMGDFHISLASGRPFADEDFIFTQGDSIPVLMGADYKELYQIGDSFEANYLYASYRFTVQGFLAPGSQLVRAGTINELNQTILLPSFDFATPPIGESEYVSQLLHRSNRASGVLRYLPQHEEEVSQALAQLLAHTDVGQYTWGTNNSLAVPFQFGLSFAQTPRVAATLAALFWVIALAFHWFLCVRWQKTAAPGWRRHLLHMLSLSILACLAGFAIAFYLAASRGILTHPTPWILLPFVLLFLPAWFPSKRRANKID